MKNLMTKSTRITYSILLVLLMTLLASCKKSTNTNNNPQDEVTLEVSGLPIYVNGVKTDSFDECLYFVSKGGDADFESITVDTAIFYFNEDSIFGNFCTLHGMQLIYEYSHKLDSIHEKASRLGLTENDTATIPQEMQSYWNSIMNGIELNPPENPRSVAYIIAWDQPFQFGNDRVFFAQNRTTLGNFNNRIESLRIAGLSGLLVGCHKTWWGKPRRWFTIIAPGQLNVPELNTSDRKKFCSYFSVG